MKPNRVFGVDFSGAADAGRKIWIAGGVIVGGTLQFELCQRAATLPHSGPQRDQAFAALRTFVDQQAPCIIGLDFPFGLPHVLVEEGQWEKFVLAFGNRYPDPNTFPKAATLVAQARTGRKELRRNTDIEAETPFSPYNLRLYRQTYHGIRDVLAPLVHDRAVSVLPMQPAVPGRAWLVEICPASTLKQMRLSQPYKRREHAPARDTILAALSHHEGIVVPQWIRDKVLADKEGDALDSVIAAVATFRALRESIDADGLAEPSLVEGRVYV